MWLSVARKFWVKSQKKIKSQWSQTSQEGCGHQIVWLLLILWPTHSWARSETRIKQTLWVLGWKKMRTEYCITRIWQQLSPVTSTANLRQPLLRSVERMDLPIPMRLTTISLIRENQLLAQVLHRLHRSHKCRVAHPIMRKLWVA